MSMLCVWVPENQAAQENQVVTAMGRALRAYPGQSWASWTVPGLAVGLLEAPTAESAQQVYAPAVSGDGRFFLWMAGEVFVGDDLLRVPQVEATRRLSFRCLLLEYLLQNGVGAITKLDGEYHIALWDAEEKTLQLINDRFGGLPLYWARSPQGMAFAGGVRGVLAVPGVPADPDPEAIREAVTFGGFRLGDRTNVAAVKMLPAASVATVRKGELSFRRYWHWTDIPVQPERPLADVIPEVHFLWKQAIARRLSNVQRPGQTLSGGLDSRAILAEASPQAPGWTAITYGVAGCDDARYARRAAAQVGATWVFHPLYSGQNPDWLERRTDYIQPTDGLIDLTDLMHLEVLPLQAQLLDVHLSGYIGDAVSGPTFNHVTTPEDVLISLPWYHTSVGKDWHTALTQVRALMAPLAAAPARFALFDHKLSQSTNRWTVAWRPWLRVRKPFVDYAFFDFCQGLPAEVRGQQRLYEQWLRTLYPQCFATVPHQKTGLPILTPLWQIRLEQGRRVAWRTVQPWLANLGFPARPRIRSYHDDATFWRTPEARARIEGTILRRDSLCCDILGREAVNAVVKDWFDRLAAPTQVIGALYVYEVYHHDLSTHLRVASRKESCG